MRIETIKRDDGFLLVLAEGGDRCRYLRWEATGIFGERDSGRIDLSMLATGSAVEVKTGWAPAEVNHWPLRDPTPGMHQPFLCHVPAGVCILELVAETGTSGQFQVFASVTGHCHDTRDMGLLPASSPGTKLETRVIMKTPWTKLIIKKMGEERSRTCLSRIMLRTTTGETFESMAHLIKPEHELLLKEGKDGMVFLPEAPRYAYFTIGFQRR